MQELQHINSNNFDNPQQSAYKTGHSTKIALLHIKNETPLSLLCDEPDRLVFLDLLAVFITIDDSTLPYCLKSWSVVCGKVLKRFTSYLSD